MVNPALSTGYNQQIGALVVSLLQAKNIPERLHATDMLAAAADSHVLVYLTDYSPEAPTIENYREDLRQKLIAAQATKPDDGDGEEAIQMWTAYVAEAEYNLTHAAEQYQSSLAQRAFVEQWNLMYANWCDLTTAMSLLVEGETAQVFHAHRKPKRAVMLPAPLALDPYGQARTRYMLLQAMGVPDHGQEVIGSHTEIMRGISALDRMILAAAGKFFAIFKELFGDLEVYRDSYYQFLALKKAEEKGRLDEALREKEMREGRNDMFM